MSRPSVIETRRLSKNGLKLTLRKFSDGTTSIELPEVTADHLGLGYNYERSSKKRQSYNLTIHGDDGIWTP